MKKPWRILVSWLLADLIIALFFRELEGSERILLLNILFLEANEVLKPED